MRLAYIARSVLPSRSANSIHVMKMASAYAQLGHQVSLVVPRRRESGEAGASDLFAFYGVAQTFRIVRVPLADWLPETLTHGVLLPLAARLLRAQLVHSRSLAAAWGATRWMRLPTLFELHDTPSENPRQRRMLDTLAASDHLLAFVTITEALAERVRGHLPAAARGRLTVAPDGVDRAVLELGTSSEEARSRLGLNHINGADGHRLAVYTGHLYPGRGVGLILELARRCDGHHFLLVGGKPEDIARRRSEAAGLSNVTFAGFVPPAEVPLYLRAADVLLMPYADRVAVAGGGDTAAWASPLKMFEYLAAGRPIVASTLPVLQEVLTDGVNALLVPHRAADGWCIALERLRDDRELADRLARRGREDAAQFTWQRRAERLLEAIDRPPGGIER